MHAYFISDSTGITVETVGSSLLAQFPGISLQKEVIPYLDTLEKAQDLVTDLTLIHATDAKKPVFVLSVVKQQIRQELQKLDGVVLDLFEAFLTPLEQHFEISPQRSVGQHFTATQNPRYEKRIDAINFALDNDDGCRLKEYADADVILVGVSRSGKTPTCIYLGLQFGIRAANYPLTPDDLESGQMPPALKDYTHKLFGLTIDPERLSDIRHQRKANSRYASLIQCEDEIRMAEQLMTKHNIKRLNTTAISVEEISTRIIADNRLKRQF